MNEQQKEDYEYLTGLEFDLQNMLEGRLPSLCSRAEDEIRSALLEIQSAAQDIQDEADEAP